MNTPWPKISIITPSFNQGEYVESTILSVLNQGYPNLEYIIIDGGSTDTTLSVIKKYQDRISYWVSEPDQGQSHAINKGLDIITGDVVGWLNSDDELYPGALFEIGKTFLDNPDCTCCIGRMELFDETGVHDTSKSILSPLLEQCIGFGKVNQPSMYFKSDCYKTLGGIDNRMNYLMDTEWFIRYLLVYGHQTIVDIEKVFSRFRFHQTSKTVSQAERFRFERDSMYYSLARQFGLDRYADFIGEYGKVKFDYVFNLPGQLRSLNKEMTLNYFVYQLGLEYYNYRVMRKAEKCLEFVNVDLLLPEEVKILKSRLFRVKNVPSFIWKLRK